MKKENAIKKANKLGYTILYDEYGDEIRLRKPGSPFNSLNQPYEYCLVFKTGNQWKAEVKIDPLML